MLKKELRVKKERDFSRIYKKGGFIGGSLFNINFLPTRGATRFGVVISKKNFKKAVERTKIKRLVKEAIRLLYPEVKANYDIVVNIKKEAVSGTVSQFKKEIEGQLKKKGIIKD